MKLKFFLLFVIGGLSSSCSFDKVPKIDALSDIFSNVVLEKIIRPEGSVEYNCDKKKTFFLSYLNEKKSVWVALPDREFRLNRIDENQNIYTNNITTLKIAPEKTQIKNEKEILYNKCVKADKKKDNS